MCSKYNAIIISLLRCIFLRELRRIVIHYFWCQSDVAIILFTLVYVKYSRPLRRDNEKRETRIGCEFWNRRNSRKAQTTESPVLSCKQLRNYHCLLTSDMFYDHCTRELTWGLMPPGTEKNNEVHSAIREGEPD